MTHNSTSVMAGTDQEKTILKYLQKNKIADHFFVTYLNLDNKWLTARCSYFDLIDWFYEQGFNWKVSYTTGIVNVQNLFDQLSTNVLVVNFSSSCFHIVHTKILHITPTRINNG